MTIFAKIRWVLGILMVFLLILFTNLIDRDNFARIEASVENLYEDELLTKQRILELSILIHEKEIDLIKQDSVQIVINDTAVNNQIRELLDGCGQRVESKSEESTLNKLTENCERLFALEQDPNNKELIFNQLEVIHFDIKDFSDVQIEEGRKEKIISRDAMASARLFARIEIYLLIILGVAIQFIVLYNPKKRNQEEEPS